MLTKLEVGKPYLPGRVSWPDGIATFDVRSGQPELIAFFARPSTVEVAAFKRGTPHFGILVDGPVIFFLFQFGQEPVSDAPYSCHLTRSSERGISECPNGHRLAVRVLLVDATTGILRAIRLVTLAPETSQELIAAMHQQAASPFDQQLYDACLQRAYTSASSFDLTRRTTMRRGGR